MKTKIKQPQSFRSLSTTLTIAFLAVSVAVLVISGGLQVISNIATLQKAVAGELQIIAQGASQSVSSYIQDKFSIMKTATKVANLTGARPAEQQQILDGLLGREPSFRQLVLLNIQGQGLAQSSRLSQQASSNLAEQLPGEALAQIKQGNSYISSVYVDPATSEPLVLLATPVTDALGDFQGTLAAEVNLKFMWDLVDQLQVGDRGVAYVVDKQGNLIAFNDTARVLRGENMANLDRVREYITGVPVNSFLDLTAGIQGIPVIGASAPLGTPDWAVITEIPWDEAYRGAIQNIIASAGILVVTSILAGLVGVYLARRLAVPLVNLTDTAAHISAGELELQAAISGPREVAQLATSFNSMTAQLHGLIGDLERRVEARTGQLQASAEVGRAVTSILDPNQLLKQVADLITKRFGFYYTAVFSVDETGQTAVLRAATGEAGRTLLERGHRLPVDENSMVGGAIVTRGARIALDVGQGAVRFANPLLPNTRSEIALPLRVGDRVLGALDVQSEQAGAFDEASAEVLQAMADQIAVALFNAETFQHSEEQAHTMSLLNQLSRNLATATSLEDIALTVLPITNSLLGQPHLAIVQKTANPQILALREFTADSSQPVGGVESIQAVGSLSGECVERGEVIYTPDLSELVNRCSDLAIFYQRGWRSSVILPLRVGDRILGTFTAGADETDAYSAEQIDQLEQITSQLAVTIENLNLAEQTQQSLADLDAANRRLIGRAWSTHTQAGGLVAAEWRTGSWSTTRQQHLPETPQSRALIPAAQTLSLPIKVRGETIGEFSVLTDEVQASWNSDDVAFAQSLIDQVGQVLENARLLEETERTAQREKAVADAADKIHRSTDIETVLHSAITELNRITGRSGISIQLGFGSAAGAERPPQGTVPPDDAAVVPAGNGQAAQPEGVSSHA